MAKLTIEGAKELEAGLLELGKSMSTRVLKKALMKAGQPVAHAGAANLRRQIKSKTGLLLEATEGVQVSDQLSKTQKRGKRRIKGGAEVYVGPYRARHAHLIEFGTAPRRTKSGAFRGAMRPRPYMRPAWDQYGEKTLDILVDEIRVEIEAARRRIAKRTARLAKKRG